VERTSKVPVIVAKGKAEEKTFDLKEALTIP
jgi:hypothetical protein